MYRNVMAVDRHDRGTRLYQRSIAEGLVHYLVVEKPGIHILQQVYEPEREVQRRGGVRVRKAARALDPRACHTGRVGEGRWVKDGGT